MYNASPWKSVQIIRQNPWTMNRYSQSILSVFFGEGMGVRVKRVCWRYVKFMTLLLEAAEKLKHSNVLVFPLRNTSKHQAWWLRLSGLLRCHSHSLRQEWSRYINWAKTNKWAYISDVQWSRKYRPLANMHHCIQLVCPRCYTVWQVCPGPLGKMAFQ